MVLERGCRRRTMLEKMNEIMARLVKAGMKTEGVFEGTNRRFLLTQMYQRDAITVVTVEMMEEQADAFEGELRGFTIMTLPTSAKGKPGERARVSKPAGGEDSKSRRN
jgi:hypothetical protein